MSPELSKLSEIIVIIAGTILSLIAGQFSKAHPNIDHKALGVPQNIIAGQAASLAGSLAGLPTTPMDGVVIAGSTELVLAIVKSVIYTVKLVKKLFKKGA